MKETIWYISKYFAPKTKLSAGGRGWFLLSELARMGYDCVVITSDSNNLIDLPEMHSSIKFEEVDGVKLIWLKTLRYSVAKSIKRVLSWFHFEWNILRLNKNSLPKPDVIVVSSLSLLTVINGLLLKHRFQCRLVFEVRDIWPLTLTEEGGFSRFNPLVILLSIIEKIGYQRSDAIIGTMQNLVEHVHDVLGYGRPVYCIPMGVSDEQVTNIIPLDEFYKKKYLGSSKIKVVHAGTVGITNALDVFFEAAVAMQDDQMVEFVIVGDGALRDYYYRRYGGLDNIVFAPKVAKNQVHSVLSECDIVYFSVHKSKVWNYGQSLNKVIDYMLSGKPVIASYTGYPSMINESGCGSFVPAGDVTALVHELKYYIALPVSERERIGQKGREWLLENRPYKRLARDFSKVLLGT
ncbi:glycosyltransferase family 4 protein [Endozoicomonas acroporae]|uniref:glycosyltransferase family 4 protein n=1 Tax=Endozoicomonas acroporae TaxID=1701104 RepID=UPI003D7BFCAF